MAESVRTADYFYVMVPDKPGEGARILGELKRAGVNLVAYSGFPEFAGDLDAVLQRARSAGVTGILTIGTDVATSRAAVALAAREPDVWAAVGIHPHDAASADEAALVDIERLASAPRVVAIGE